MPSADPAASGEREVYEIPAWKFQQTDLVYAGGVVIAMAVVAAGLVVAYRNGLDRAKPRP